MTRDRTFNMRVTEEEWERFEAVAAHYQLPVASVVRMLVKEKEDLLKARLQMAHHDVLHVLALEGELSLTDLAASMRRKKFRVGALAETLDQLQRWGFLTLERDNKYWLTRKGRTPVE